MIPAVALGHVDDLFVGFLATVIPAIPRETGAIEMGKRGRQPETLRCCRGKKTVEFGDPLGLERL
jgi:hypothetical protein